MVEHPVYLALESKQKVETVFCISNQKDEKVHISMLSTPVFKTEKRQVLKYVILAFEDITEQKQDKRNTMKNIRKT